jgi:hypothetical protein
MNEPQFGDKIAHLLNQGLRLDGQKLALLRAAREQALLRQRPESTGLLVWAGNVIGDWGGWGGVSLRLLAPVVALAIAFSAVYTWQQNQRAAEVEEIDALLLTSDLPIDAYLDRGFQNFLKTRSAEQ